VPSTRLKVFSCDFVVGVRLFCCGQENSCENISVLGLSDVDISPHSIYADDRERPSGIAEILRTRFRMPVVESRLPVGDYWLGSGIIVERRMLDDFALSIIDGRLFRQS
jgi:ERCC4-type nuclease